MAEDVGIFLLLSLILIFVSASTLIDRASKLARYTPYNVSYPTKRRKVRIPFAQISDTHLTEMSQRVATSLQVLVAIYGVLLAFVVSTNAGLAFTSWSFSIWSGFTLAILIRVGLYSIHLSLSPKIVSRAELEDIVFASSQFFRVAVVMLVPSVAFVPAFSAITTPRPIDVSSKYGWTLQTSVGIALISIFGLTVVFYSLMHTNRYLTEGGIPGLYLYASTLLISLGVSGLALSPLEPESITIFGFWNYIVPSLVLVAIEFVGVLGAISLFVIIGVSLVRIGRLIRGKLASRNESKETTELIGADSLDESSTLGDKRALNFNLCSRPSIVKFLI